jgi:hypothetical protein
MIAPKTVIGSGVLISKAFVLDTKRRFTSIRIDSGSVEIKVGSTNQIVVEAEDNVVPLLQVYVEKNVLVISSSSCLTSVQPQKTVRYSIELTAETLRTIKNITYHGPGSLTIIDDHVRFAPNFDLQSTGACNINFANGLSESKTVYISSHGAGHIVCTTLRVDELNIHVTGNGTIVIKDGNAKNVIIKKHGPGLIDMHMLDVSNNIDITTTGSGTIDCLTRSNINARINGDSVVINHAQANTKKIKKSKRGEYREIV